MFLEALFLFLGALDVILTHYTFKLRKKHNAFSIKDEVNWLPRKLIGDNPCWKNSFKHALIMMFVYTLLIYFSFFVSPSVNYYNLFISFVCGLLFMVNYLHLLNINYHFDNCDNPEYWVLVRKSHEVVKRD